MIAPERRRNMKVLGTALISSFVLAVVSHGVFNLTVLGALASYVVSGQVVLGVALIAAIVLNTKT